MKEKLLHIMSFIVLVAFFSMLPTTINATQVTDYLGGMPVTSVPSKVTTRYVDIVSGQEIASRNEVVGVVGQTYTTSSKTVSGYKLEVTPSNATGTYASVPTVVDYKYRKQLTVTTKHVDEITGTVLNTSSQVLGQEAEYVTRKKTIAGYSYTRDTGNVSGYVGDSNIEVIFYYKRNTGTVVTKYVDVETNAEIAPSVTTTDLEGASYEAEIADVDRYTLEVIPANATGVYTSGRIDVTYKYRKKSYVTTIYKDIVNNVEITDQEKEDLKQGDPYTTREKYVTGYTCVGNSHNTDGFVGASDITVTYNYKKNSAPVYTKYVDVCTGKEIAEHKVQTGLEGEGYTTTPETIANYVLEETALPANANGNFATTNIEVIYKYRKQLDVVTRYVDAVSGDNIIAPVTQKWLQEKIYSTDGTKTFPNYTATGNSGNTSGVVEANNIEVIYYYKRNSAPVVTKFVDVCSGETIAEDVSQTGLESEPYETAPITIDGYVLEEAQIPENATGEYKVTEIDVVYKYRKQVKVVTRYEDEVNHVEIYPRLEKIYLQEDEYTTEPSDFEKYTQTRDSGNTTGVVAADTITVTYYYKRNSNPVYTNYIDVSTKEPLAESFVQTGLEGEPYETEPIEIEGYVLETATLPANATGAFAVEDINVNYEYRKIVKVVTIHKDAVSGEEIAQRDERDYLEADRYVTAAVNVPGYVLTTTPENKVGDVGREEIQVTYFYKKISNGIIVKYVDKINNQILDTKVYTGNEKDRIDFVQEEFDGYVMFEAPSPEYAEMTVGVQEFVYYYYKNVALLVNGIDQRTREVLWAYTIEAVEGENYTTTPREVPGYTLVSVPENANGVHSRINTVVYYEYKRNALLGDINCDGYINSTDAAYVLDLFKNGNATAQDYIYGDMNKDGNLNSTDAAMILDLFKNS